MTPTKISGALEIVSRVSIHTHYFGESVGYSRVHIPVHRLCGGIWGSRKYNEGQRKKSVNESEYIHCKPCTA